MDVGQVSVDATVNEANPTPKTALKAASTPMTASGERTAASVSVSMLHRKKDTPVECSTFWSSIESLVSDSIKSYNNDPLTDKPGPSESVH